MSKINSSEWKQFIVGDILLCETTNALNPRKVKTYPGDIPYITRSSYNNGQTDSFDNNEYVCEGRCITIGAEGKTAFYQPNDFIPGIKVYTLRNKNLNEYNSLFLVTALNVLVDNYTYADARVLDAIKQEIIYLPTKDGKNPDWEYMAEYIKIIISKIKQSLNNLINNESVSQIDVTSWAPFTLKELFEIKKGKRLTKVNMIPGDIKFVGSSKFNNGETNRISNNTHIHPAGVISVCYNGSIGETFYQDEPFWASDDVNVLYPKFELTKNIAMFLIPLIRNVGTAEFEFVDKWTKELMEKTKIKLPIDSNGKPHWEYMEEYIKQMYSKSVSQFELFKQL